MIHLIVCCVGAVIFGTALVISALGVFCLGAYILASIYKFFAEAWEVIVR